MDFIKDVKDWVKGEEARAKKQSPEPVIKAHVLGKSSKETPPPPIEKWTSESPMRDFIKIHNLYSRISSIDSVDFDDKQQQVSAQFKNGNIIKQTIADTQDYNRIKQTLTKLFQ